MQEYQEYIEKAKILVEALPYIKEFNGKTVVIKYGGSALVEGAVRDTVMQDIALMKLVGIRPVVVHGGGPEINAMLKRLGVEPAFLNGLRVTDGQTMEIVEMVLAGKINKDITTELQMQGIKAAGISGKDGGTLRAKKKAAQGADLGFVGEISAVDTGLLTALIERDFVPVVSSVAMGEEGQSYNINADYAAVSVAVALSAEKLVFLTDVPGILERAGDENSLLSEIGADALEAMIRSGEITGGMIPKATCAIDATRAGVKNVHVLDGRTEHCLLLEIFTKYGIGTMVK